MILMQLHISYKISLQKCYRTMMIAGFTVILVGHLLVGPAPFLTFLPAKYVYSSFCILL